MPSDAVILAAPVKIKTAQYRRGYLDATFVALQEIAGAESTQQSKETRDYLCKLHERISAKAGI